MRATPKWNEELPLTPRAPLPPPRRYEIEVDGKTHALVLRRVAAPRPAGGPRIEKSQYEITGTSLREDELMEHAADASKDALVLDGRGGLHRPGETIHPVRRLKVGDAFFPPTYVGRATRIRRRSRLTRARASAAFLGAALANGTCRIAGDGGVYLRNEMGVFKKIGKVAKKTVKVATKPVRATAKVTARVAVKPVARAVVKPVARTTSRLVKPAAKAVARTATSAAKKTVKVAKATSNVVKDAARWTSSQIAAAAKVAARVAATPIRLAVRPAVNAAIKKLSAGRPLTARTRVQANALVIAQLKRHPNPLVKFAGHVLSYVGTGVSGVPSIGLALVRRDTARGHGLIVGGTFIRGQTPSVMGLTGAEIAAMAKASALSLVPVVKKMVADFAVSKGTQLAVSALSPSTRAASMPIEVAPPPPVQESSFPSAADYDYAETPSADEYETSIAPLEEPSSYNHAAEESDGAPEDDSSGLISYGWSGGRP